MFRAPPALKEKLLPAQNAWDLAKALLREDLHVVKGLFRDPRYRSDNMLHDDAHRITFLHIDHLVSGPTLRMRDVHGQLARVFSMFWAALPPLCDEVHYSSEPSRHGDKQVRSRSTCPTHESLQHPCVPAAVS